MVKKTITKTTKTVIDDGKKKTVHKKTTSTSPKKAVKKVAKKTPKKATKKVAKKKVAKRKPVQSRMVIHKDTSKRDDMLAENFVGLQHAMTNLSIKFGEMSQNITKLLSVFEEAAKDLANTEKQVDSAFERKLDALIDQNKTIAKGLVLMDGKLKGQMSRGPSSESGQASKPQSMSNVPSSQPMSMPQSQMPSGAPSSSVGSQPQLQSPSSPQLTQPSFPPVSSNKPKPLPQL